MHRRYVLAHCTYMFNLLSLLLVDVEVEVEVKIIVLTM